MRTPLGRSSSGKCRAVATRRLTVESLEDRRLLASVPRLLADLNTGDADGSNPTELTPVGNLVYFQAKGVAEGRELWVTDGTGAGTRIVKDIAPGSSGSYPNELTNVNGTLFFLANGDELWKSDGTESGTSRIVDLVAPYDPGGICVCFPGMPPRFGDLTDVNGTLFFSKTWSSISGGSWELWKSDGTAAGTVLVKSLTNGDIPRNAHELIEAGGLLYFIGADQNGGGLWRSDGTLAGTQLVKPFDWMDAGSEGIVLGSFGEDLFFLSRSMIDHSRMALWRSDGTAAGTVVVKDFGKADQGQSFILGYPAWPAVNSVINGELYFMAADDAHGFELWKTDGTGAGTIMVADLHSGPTSSSINGIAGLGKSVFVASNAYTPEGFVSHVREMWHLEASGTRLIHDTSNDPIGSGLGGLTPFDGKMYFVAREYEGGEALWTTDGTTAGTIIAADLWEGAQHEDFGKLTVSNGRLLFAARDGQYGRELWKLEAQGCQESDRPDADFNADCSVNRGDFLLLMRNYGRWFVAQVAQGDLNGDGRVGLRDLVLLRNRFGAGSEAGASPGVADAALVSRGQEERELVGRKLRAGRRPAASVEAVVDRVMGEGSVVAARRRS